MSKTRHIADLVEGPDQVELSHRVNAADRHPGGHRIHRHHHLTNQLIYPSSGIVEVTTSAGTWITPSDRAIWVPAGSWHQHRCYGTTEFNCVAIAPDVTPFAADPDATAGPVVVRVTPLLRELILECARADDDQTEAQQRLRTVLVDQLRRSDDPALALATPTDDRLVRACSLVTADLGTNHSLAEIGRHVGAAERTLSRLFREQLGLTYPQWRTQARLHRALILLADGANVTDVAHRCGWAAPSAFIDSYRRTLGHTPGSRKQR